MYVRMYIRRLSMQLLDRSVSNMMKQLSTFESFGDYTGNNLEE